MTDRADTFAAVAASLSRTLSRTFQPRPASRVHGGCINESFRWESADGPVFVKLAAAAQLPMLEAEAAGLHELERAAAVAVPHALATGATQGAAFLALEWIDLTTPSSQSQATLGAQLAHQHRVTSERFGWNRNNTIGLTPQINEPHEDWATFFRERRLRFQLDLARRKGFGGRLQQRGEQLLEGLNAFFEHHHPPASLLHGDLWGGNAASDRSGNPVVFDPAVYFGDRETDIAMTRLFGGFSTRFFSAYEAEWPLPDSAAEREPLYNLYHVLNHLNLFGGSYARQAEDLIDQLLAHLAH